MDELIVLLNIVKELHPDHFDSKYGVMGYARVYTDGSGSIGYEDLRVGKLAMRYVAIVQWYNAEEFQKVKQVCEDRLALLKAIKRDHHG